MILERGADGFSRIQPLWKGEPVVCIGGGPSLTLEQVEAVRESGARVIAVNDAYLWAPFADLCFFADFEWWAWHSKGIAKPKLGLTAEDVARRFAAFPGQRCTIEHAGARIPGPDVHRIRQAGPEGLSLDPTRLVTGRHSGFMAFNAAILSGGDPILLLAYDAREPKGVEPTHWHGGHPRREPESVYKQHRRAFTVAEQEIRKTAVRVINATPGSAIESFEKMPLAAALELCPSPTV